MQGNLGVSARSHSVKYLQLKSISQVTIHAFFLWAPDEISCRNAQLGQNFHVDQVDGGKVEAFRVVPEALGNCELEGLQCVGLCPERCCEILD